MHTLWEFIAMIGIFQLENIVRIFFSDVSLHYQWHHLGLGKHSAQPKSLPRVVMNDRIALDFTLAGQGRVSAINNKSWYIWIIALGQIESQNKYKDKAS